jgi:hypothetical protein
MLAARSDTPCSPQDWRHACPPKFLVTCAVRGGRQGPARKKKIFSIFVSDLINKEEKITSTFKISKKRVKKIHT